MADRKEDLLLATKDPAAMQGNLENPINFIPIKDLFLSFQNFLEFVISFI